MVSQPNPYVGPRPFEQSEAEVFFGREREVRKLAALLLSERVVLVYAASGAGKTSLLMAGLSPRLEQRHAFEIFPPARVRLSEEAPEASRNVFIASVLADWSSGVRPSQPGSQKPASPLRLDTTGPSGSTSATTLREHLGQREHPLEPDGPVPRLVIFDQAEELFTAYPEHWTHRKPFFQQVADALEDDSLLYVIFAIREDFIAELDPYTRFLPGDLRARFRLERLGPDAAFSAVTGPLRRTARHFAPGVAERLVDDLLTARVDTGTGASDVFRGQFVEPVQLQVVCADFWSRLPASVVEITESDVEQHAVVDKALMRFFESVVARAAQVADIPATRLSIMCEETFITEADTRNSVLRGPSSTGAIPNQAIDELAQRHLIRAEWNRGARWYELTHDRMIAPIREFTRDLRGGETATTRELDIARRASAALAGAEDLRLTGHLPEALERAQSARAHFSEIEPDHPGVADAVLKEGEVLYAMNRLEEAMGRFLEAQGLYAELADRAAEAQSWQAISTVAQAQGDTERALQALTFALERYEDVGETTSVVRVLSRTGEVLFERGDLDRALETFDKGIGLAHDIGDLDGEATARTSRSLVSFDQGAYADALEDTEIALRIFGEMGNRSAEAVLLGNLGHIADASGDHTRALESWSSAELAYRELGEHADAARILLAMASRTREQGDLEDAVAFLSRGLEWNPDDVELLRERALVRLSSGQFDEALADLDAAIERDGHHAMTLVLRGYVLSERGRFADAIADVDHALQVLSDDARLQAVAHGIRGFALAGQSEFDQGIAELNASLVSWPGNAWGLFQRATLRERQGEQAAAATDLERAFSQSDPPLTPFMAREAEAARDRVRMQVGPTPRAQHWLGRTWRGKREQA
jgi:tetratricopeptide (TPR) repeat protein